MWHRAWWDTEQRNRVRFGVRIAEVKGRVEHVHPRLASGELIAAGEELLRIDPTEYELAVAQLEADIQQANAQLSRTGDPIIQLRSVTQRSKRRRSSWLSESWNVFGR